MNMEKTKVKISICGYEFSVITDEDKKYMMNIANRVERKVNSMLESNGRLSTASAALFAAMDYCDQVQKATGDGDNLRGQIKDYLEESSEARRQLEESRREVDRLKREVAALRRRIDAEEAYRPYEAYPDADEASDETAEAVTPQRVTVEKKSDRNEERKKKKSSKVRGKDKQKKEDAPMPGFFNEDAFAESADATAEILSFFEKKAFEEEDE